MFARLERGNGHFGVEGVGRGDGNDVDIRVGYQLTPVAGRFLEPQRRGLFCRQVGIGSGEVDEARAFDVSEDRRDGVPGQCMALAHVAGSDQADAERCHWEGLRRKKDGGI